MGILRVNEVLVMAGIVAPERLRAEPANRMRYLITNRRCCETFPGAAPGFGCWKSYGFHVRLVSEKYLIYGESFPRLKSVGRVSRAILGA